MSNQTFHQGVVWITGGSSGIGKALALEFARQGALVAISGRRPEPLEAVVKEIQDAGGQALSVTCDITEENQLQAAVDQVISQWGRLDVAIANAGFAVGGTIESLSAADWRRQLDTNVVGSALTARFALPHLRKTNGRLVLVGSVCGLISVPGNGAYTASKYALRAIGQTLALELDGTGVSCTLIQPGFVESNIARVDNQGQLHPDRDDRRPARLMWPADRAARTVVRAIAQRKREYVFTGHGKLGAFVGQHFPGLSHAVITRVGRRRNSSHPDQWHPDHE